MNKFKIIFNSYSLGDQSNHILLAHFLAKQNNLRLILIPWIFIKVNYLKIQKRGNNSLFRLKSDHTIDNCFIKSFFFILIVISKIFIFIKILFLWFFFRKKITSNEISIMNRSSLESLYENIDIKLAKTEKFDHNFNFRFSPREFEFSKNYLKKNFDIDYKKKYAILHVRDNSVDKSKELSSIMRNSNIDNYNLAINKLIKSGYKVIRLGGKESNKNNLIKSNLNNNYIEYCYSKLKLPIIDLFLIQNADIILGTQSGVVETGSLFPNVKILTTNMLPNTLYWSPKKKI